MACVPSIMNDLAPPYKMANKSLTSNSAFRMQASSSSPPDHPSHNSHTCTASHNLAEHSQLRPRPKMCNSRTESTRWPLRAPASDRAS